MPEAPHFDAVGHLRVAGAVDRPDPQSHLIEFVYERDADRPGAEHEMDIGHGELIGVRGLYALVGRDSGGLSELQRSRGSRGCSGQSKPGNGTVVPTALAVHGAAVRSAGSQWLGHAETFPVKPHS